MRYPRAMNKLALRLNSEGRAALHFEQPDWKSFERNLRSDAFRKAVLKAEQSDPKLKKYVRTFGAYQGSKDTVAVVTSVSSGKKYKVKDLHNGRLGCNCKDWQFIHSIKGGDCKHIKSLKESKMKFAMVGTAARGLAQSYRLNSRRQNLRESGRAAKEILQATRSQQHTASLKQQIYGHWV